ncbi:MAG: hypothetical protein ACYTFT_17495, partial [Planctomycetota bacterium]
MALFIGGPGLEPMVGQSLVDEEPALGSAPDGDHLAVRSAKGGVADRGGEQKHVEEQDAHAVQIFKSQTALLGSRGEEKAALLGRLQVGHDLGPHSGQDLPSHAAQGVFGRFEARPVGEPSEYQDRQHRLQGEGGEEDPPQPNATGLGSHSFHGFIDSTRVLCGTMSPS